MRKNIGKVISLALVVTAFVGSAAPLLAADERPLSGVTVEIAKKDKEDNAEAKERKTMLEAAQKNWKALTAEQKAEVYSIQEQIIALKTAKLDKLATLGVLPADKVEQMKAKMQEKLKEQKDKDLLPLGKCR